MVVQDLLKLLEYNVEINLEDEAGTMTYIGSVEEFKERFYSLLTAKVDYINPYGSNQLRIVIAND